MLRIGVLLAAFGLPVLCGIGIERVDAQGIGERPRVPSDAFAPSTVYPGVREFRWTFHVPTLTFENREITVDAPSTATRSKRWDFQAPVIGTEHRSLGKFPEFSCKYADLMLPNECRTVWRDVYADLPVLVEQHRHVDFEVPSWQWEKLWFPVLVPRWTWRDRSLTVSVPAIVTEKP